MYGWRDHLFVSELNNEYVTREMFETVLGGKDVIHETKRFIATLPEEKQANVANMHRKFCDVRTKGFRDMLADRQTHTHTHTRSYSTQLLKQPAE